MGFVGAGLADSGPQLGAEAPPAKRTSRSCAVMRILLSALLCIALAAMLVTTIYYTRHDLQWLAFLGGVLFAAVLALASQVSKAEWQLLRRSRQLERTRMQLALELANGSKTTQALHGLANRVQRLHDGLPVPLLYVDAEQRCGYHNKACADWLATPLDGTNGQLLRDVLGPRRYEFMAHRIAKALAGEAQDYDTWPGSNGEAASHKVRLMPETNDDGGIAGFYVVAAPLAGPAGPEEAAARPRIDRENEGERAGGGEPRVEASPKLRLEQALERDEFLLFVQKILPLRSGLAEPDCYEVLLRLREEEDLLLPPGGFIPIAEHCGMLEQLDRWVVRSLIARVIGKSRTVSGWRIPLFCINLSSPAVTSPGFAAFIQQEVRRTGFPTRALCFEISELDAASEGGSRLVGALKPLGCRFSIDGYSGAAPAAGTHHAAMDFLKIDRSITQNVARDPLSRAGLQAIHAACKAAGRCTIAGFVETRETLEVLRAGGIDYVQGFGIARPVPFASVV